MTMTEAAKLYVIVVVYQTTKNPVYIKVYKIQTSTIFQKRENTLIFIVRKYLKDVERL